MKKTTSSLNNHVSKKKKWLRGSQKSYINIIFRHEITKKYNKANKTKNP